MIEKISSTSFGDNPRDGSSRRIRLRLGDEGAADGEHLLLAAGQVAGKSLAPLVQPREIGIDEVERCRTKPAAGERECRRRQVLLDGQVLEDAPALHDVKESPPDEAVRGQGCDVDPVEADAAGGHRAVLQLEQVRDGLEEGGFAGSVGSEQGHDLSARDAQGQAAKHLDRPVVDDLDVVDVQEDARVHVRHCPTRIQSEAATICFCFAS